MTAASVRAQILIQIALFRAGAVRIPPSSPCAAKTCRKAIPPLFMLRPATASGSWTWREHDGEG